MLEDAIEYVGISNTVTYIMNTLVLFGQFPEFFSFGVFSKAGPTRKQVGFLPLM